MSRPSGYIKPKGWAATKRRILARDGGACYLCGDTAVTADHVIPRSQDGSDDDDNLAAICGPCHDVKTEGERRFGIAKRKARIPTTRKPEAHPGRRA